MVLPRQGSAPEGIRRVPKLRVDAQGMSHSRSVPHERWVPMDSPLPSVRGGGPVNLKLPTALPSGASGFTSMENNYVDRCMDKISRNSHMGGGGVSTVVRRRQVSSDVQRVQITQTLSDIDALRRLHNAVFAQAFVPEATTPAAAGMGPPGRKMHGKMSDAEYEERVRQAAVEQAALVEHERELRANRMGPHERISQRLELLRVDEPARRALEARVLAYQVRCEKVNLPVRYPSVGALQ